MMRPTTSRVAVSLILLACGGGLGCESYSHHHADDGGYDPRYEPTQPPVVVQQPPVVVQQPPVVVQPYPQPYPQQYPPQYQPYPGQPGYPPVQPTPYPLPPQRQLEDRRRLGLLVNQGRDRVDYKAPERGTLSILDDESDRLIITTFVKPGDVVEVRPSQDRILVNGKSIYDRNLEKTHRHILFFKPDRDGGKGPGGPGPGGPRPRQ